LPRFRANSSNGPSLALTFRMSQKSVEIVIGRLITDEGLRTSFYVDPVRILSELESNGLQLNPGEFAALVEMPVAAWVTMSAWIHPRLQKVAMKGVQS